MQLENTFTVKAPLSAVWTALQDPQVVAPCFPGATLTEYVGDTFSGDVKLKVGPITMNYQGKGTYIERATASHTIVIDARGRDARGQGTAAAKVTGSLKALTDDETEVTMVADVAITGRAAQFGRAVIVEVADRIIGQFAQRLARTLSGSGTTALPSSVAAAPVQETDDSLNLITVAVLPGLKRALPTIATIAELGLLTAIYVELRRIRRRG